MKTSFADSSLPENEYFIMFRVIYFHELLVFLEAFLSFPVQSQLNLLRIILDKIGKKSFFHF